MVGSIPPHISSRACHWKVDLPCNSTNFAGLPETLWRAQAGTTEWCCLKSALRFTCLGTLIRNSYSTCFVFALFERMGKHIILFSHPLHGCIIHCSGISTARAILQACWLSRAFATAPACIVVLCSMFLVGMHPCHALCEIFLFTTPDPQV